MPGLPPAPPPLDLDAIDMLALFRAGALSPLDVFDAAAARLEEVNPRIHAFHFTRLDAAREEARARTEDLAHGRSRGPLHGLPAGIKELFDVAGLKTCFGSTIFLDRIPSRDAAAVERLEAAGAIVLGNTRSHEFGWGITTQHHALPSTRNPRNLDYVPGGSSGGSAAAVAAGVVPVALGSDTGGSIRIPAAFCGVVGFKPTYGRVSLRGACPLAPSLDHGGPLARSVRDVGLMLAVLGGYDEEDPATWSGSELPAGVAGDVYGVRVALVPDLHAVPLSGEVSAALTDAAKRLEQAGASIGEAAFADAEEIRPTFATIQMAEAYYVHTEVLGMYPQRGGEYGADVRGRLEAAAGVSATSYVAARERARLFRRRFERLFAHWDALLLPVQPAGPSLVATPEIARHQGADAALRDLVMPYTVPQDLVGMPALAVPAGQLPDGLPVSVQIMTAPGDEAKALALATHCHLR